MKKTLLAIAIPAIMIASSASAAFDFYNEGRVRVFTEGDFIVTAGADGRSGFEKAESNTIAVNTAKVAFGAEVAIDSCLSAFAYTQFRLESNNGRDNRISAGSGANQDRALVGFRCSQWGQIQFGRMAMISDEMSIDVSHDLNVGRAKDFLIGTDSDHAIKYQYGSKGAQGFYFGASYSAPDHKDGATGYDAVVAYNQGMFEVRAYYAGRQNIGMGIGDRLPVEFQTAVDTNSDYTNMGFIFDEQDGLIWDYTTAAYKGKIQAWDLEALFHFDALQFGLSYGQTKYKSGATQATVDDDPFRGTVTRVNGALLGTDDLGNDVRLAARKASVDTFSGFVTYQIDKQWKVGAGFNYNKVKTDRDSSTIIATGAYTVNEFSEDYTNAYLFVDYQMHKNVMLFAEVGYLSTTNSTLNNGLNRKVDDDATYAKDGVFYDEQFRNYAVEIGLEVKF